ncbi:hypothetical protein [Kordiimonas pumila]|uniref:Uncharacterized protein n=1 Tax=Kordiimonas pumila TaxID=2161677 RepID=A0ABV7D7Z3_9PROT
MTPLPYALSSKNWIGKASAGAILGFSFAIALSGLLAWFGPGGLLGGINKLQVNMWLVSPVWVAVLSICFLFKNGWSAWMWLGLLNCICFGALYGGRFLFF